MTEFINAIALFPGGRGAFFAAGFCCGFFCGLLHNRAFTDWVFRIVVSRRYRIGGDGALYAKDDKKEEKAYCPVCMKCFSKRLLSGKGHCEFCGFRASRKPLEPPPPAPVHYARRHSKK